MKIQLDLDISNLTPDQYAFLYKLDETFIGTKNSRQCFYSIGAALPGNSFRE